MDNKIPHILIVDDDANLLATMSDVLKLKGFEPIKAQTGGMALELLEKHHFELALIDLRLGDMSGLIILRAIKTHSPETECILLTGHASQNSAIEAIQMGAYGYFQKPFDMDQVLLSIQRALEKNTTEKALLESERFAHATVDALSSHLAILDETGTILSVNRAWREFAKANSSEDHYSKLCEGANYLSVCDNAKGKDSEEAAAIAAGIRAVMSGKKNEFLLEYPCHAPNEKRWFTAHVTRFPGAGPLRIVVAHENITERNQAEVALQDSEKRFRALIENGRDNISLLAADGTLLWESPSTKSTLGYAPNQFVGRTLFELLHPDDQDRTQDLFAKIIQTPGKSQDNIFRLQHGDGTWRWIESTATNLLNEPSVRAIIINYRDISERMRAEEKLIQAERRFRSLIENAPDGVVLVGLEGTYKYTSPAALRIFGYKAEDAYGHSPANDTHPEDLPKVLQVLQDLIANPSKVPTIQYRFKHADGSWRWIESTFTNLLAEPSTEAIVINFHDITEHKQAQEAQQQSELQFRALFELSPDAVMLIDPHDPDISWPIIDCNPTACQMNGYRRDELIGRSIDIINTTPGEQAERNAYLERLRKAGNVKLETFHRHKNGTVFPIEVSTSLIKVGDRELLVGIDRDITERKQAEIEIKERTEELELINALNESVNHGNNLDEVMEIFSSELHKISMGKDSSLYLLSPDGESLVMQHLNISPTLLKKIEQMTGSPLPKIRIPVKEGGSFQSALHSEQGIILDDPKVIQNRLKEFTETSHLPVALRGLASKLVPQIHKLLDIRSVLVIPLISDKKVIGLLDVASAEILTEKDLHRIQKISGQLTAVIQHVLVNEALSESEERYRAIFDGVQDAIFVEAKDGRILEVNNSACEMYGYERNEFLKKTVSDFVLEGSVVFTPQSSSPSVPLETVNRRANGELFSIEITGRLQVINGEEVVLAIVRDITKRKEAEDALRESEAQFRSLFENSITGISQALPDGRLIRANAAYAQMYGYASPEEMATAAPNVEQLYANPQDREVVLSTLREKSVMEPKEMEVVHRNGTRFIVLVGAHEIKDSKGNLLYYQAEHTDITDRKRAEVALRESEALYRQAIEVAGAVPYLQSYDSNGIHIHYNFIGDGIRQITGYSVEEFNTTIFDSLIQESILLEDLAGYSMEEAIRKVRSGQIPLWKCEHRIRARDGKIHWVFEAAVELYAENGAAKGSIGMFQDITERKKDEEKLITSETRYRRLFEAARDGILILDADTGIVLNVNPFLVEMLGTPQEEILGKELWELGFFKDIAANKSNFLELQQKEYIRYDDLPLETAQGKRFQVEFVSNVYQVNHEKVVQCNIRDITERKKAEELIIEQSQQLRLLYEASQQLNRTLDQHEIYQAICDFMSTVASNDGLVISAFDPEKQLITCRAYWMENKWLDVSSFPPIPLEAEGKGTQSIVIRTGRSMLINDYQAQMKTAQTSYYVNSEDIVEELPEEEEEVTRSALIVPLRIGGLVSGVIQVMSYRLNAYTESQLKLLEALALHIASAEQNALLYAQVQTELNERKQAEGNIRQHVKELELLYETGLMFSQLLNPREIAQKIINLLGEKMNWHHTTIRLIRAQNELELVAFDQPGMMEDKTAIEAHFKTLITRVGEGLSGWAIQQSKTMRIGDLSSDPHYVATYPDLHSGLYVPLKAGDHILGVISIESKQPNAFSEADEQLLTTLANQAANAFENARLYEETNRYAQELEQRVQERTADLSIVNADLARAVRVKDEFLASMSHELRTPLTGILGLSEVLQLKIYGELNDKQSTTLKNIETSGRHLLELINDILDLSKIEAGKLDLQFEPYSVGDICQASLQLTKGMAQHKHQHVNYSPPAESIIIRADARRLKQMLVNLLSNAIKFTPENGEIGLEVQADESERKVKLIVWDKGIGIKPEDMDKIFKPFTQLDSGLAREYSGTGLGLSLVQHLIELHNGGIEVESNIGQGSRFIIVLPWSPQSTTPIPYNTMRRGDTGRLNVSALFPDRSKAPLVMYVDDNEMVLQMVGDFLEAQQYKVIKVRNGLELLKRAAETHPNIMLVDIQMPGIGGLETIRRIRAHPDPLVAVAPVIAVTALAMPADRERCLRAGANDYMSKPLKLKELAATIERLLERK